MYMTSRLAVALLATTALNAPGLALAQEGAPAAPADETAAPAASDPTSVEPQEEQEAPEVSIPGADIVVTGRRDANISKSSNQVVSVLTTAEIARTGEGNIAGALGRVTGLSVVGSGYVYVRGLGDRYSLALLNGSPLPSPEPLKRVVPLDIFPSNVIASSLVQKSYSVNYPGEFGGGVINLTTRAVPRERFLTIGAGISGDSETTGQLGYTYYGSKSDWTGFDNGSRDVPPALKAFFASGDRISSGTVNTRAIASEFFNRHNSVVQRVPKMYPNSSVNLSAGDSFMVGDVNVGLIAAAGYSNRWNTREATQQNSFSSDLSTLETDFRRVSTQNRIVVNGLFGLGLEFGKNRVSWTSLYIRDTVKQARLGIGRRQGGTADFLQQDTRWFERQLIDTQIVGEVELMDGLELDVRGTYANSQREAPFETFFEYVRTNAAADPFGAVFVNRLRGGNSGNATISFSDLNEDLWAGSADLSWKASSGLGLSIGGAWSDTRRYNSRRDFLVRANSLPSGVEVLRPDVLLSPAVINAFNIGLIEGNEGNPVFDATLRNWAGYAKVNWQATDILSIDVGVRYEKAKQVVKPVEVFRVPGASTASTSLDNGYWLPAATLTWQMDTNKQFRVSASKTLARPQFRELIFQSYYDPESNRQYQGNPLLVDSQLYNGEARFEWYFAPEQRFSIAGFYKLIDKPIESYIAASVGDPTTSFANAPEAELWGGEIELVKYFDLFGLGGEKSFFATRRAVLVSNYTFTKSSLKVGRGDKTAVFGAASSIASDYFRNGTPLTGQSDHIVNLQLGIESTERLSQLTLLMTYASERVISRGLNGSPPQPDVIEKPGLRFDIVAREGIKIAGQELELKAEARNITGRSHIEYQQSNGNRIDTNSYKEGRSFSLSASLKF